MINKLLFEASKAKKYLQRLDDDDVNRILLEVADALIAARDTIVIANEIDLSHMDASNPKYDRLKLTADRIRAIAGDMQAVVRLPSPRRVIDTRVRPNGLEIKRIAVPFGVVGVIYEARPNVTADVFSLCFKSSNVCVLKGGHDAAESNRAIIDVIHGVLTDNGLPTAVATLLPPTREATDELLSARGLVDLIIPRGSAALIQNVRDKSQVPVIETGAGVCHCYIDSTADVAMATDLVLNAKTRRVSVCNALDCVVCHEDILVYLPQICAPLAGKRVAIYADRRSFDALAGCYPSDLLFLAQDDDFGTEYLSYAMAIKTVSNFDEALEHIDTFGSGHSESAVTRDEAVASRFYDEVDAACVYVNAPTSFTDGAQFGLGAEIGISTQKLHARGPMALEELMTYKWLIHGTGQTRP